MQVKQTAVVIVLYHKNNKVVKVSRDEEILSFPSDTIAAILIHFAKNYPQDWLVWCNIDLESHLNISNFSSIFHHHKIMASYGISNYDYIPETIGYVEESPFIKVNKYVCYPTWIMSSDAGGIHASVLQVFEGKIKKELSFDYFINSVAKLGMPLGLFCYSDPRLLSDKNLLFEKKAKSNNYHLFRFVSQHYKKRWLLLLLLNLLVFEKRFPLAAFCYALLFKNRKKIPLNLDAIQVQSILDNVSAKTIDVIIPTIGRKQYLYDVLRDLAQQTHLPEKVIVVEQNPNPDTVSELDYIRNESWPFTIKLIFTHQAGACNARNLALEEVSSEWVFLADDDIRFETLFFQKVFEKIEQYKVSVVTTSCLQANEIQHYKTIHQSGIFGSGNSFVKKSCLKNMRFDMALEFGYGEDTDFGFQLRYKGHDVICFPDLKITHLKAPMGGFRMPVKKQWESDSIQPKPSPTVMYTKMKNYSLEQLRSYKTVLFFKYYRVQKIKNPIRYFIRFQKQWEKSVYWANKLKAIR